MKTSMAILVATLLLFSASGVRAEADYELLEKSLEPLRSAFDAASGSVRAVLLVGPT